MQRNDGNFSQLFPLTTVYDALRYDYSNNYVEIMWFVTVRWKLNSTAVTLPHFWLRAIRKLHFFYSYLFDRNKSASFLSFQRKMLQGWRKCGVPLVSYTILHRNLMDPINNWIKEHPIISRENSIYNRRKDGTRPIRLQCIPKA